jgi:hypothetical protein
MRLMAVPVIALALVGVAACGGSAKPSASATTKPQLSASAACSDFSKWYLSTSGHLADASKLARLLIATSEAPSGQLYQDLSTLESDVITASKASGGLGQAEENMTVSAAYAVEQDCQSVNPAS